jgi:signal transduction histidine kinase/DNA-binding NarL/FixJ family response regulator
VNITDAVKCTKKPHNLLEEANGVTSITTMNNNSCLILLITNDKSVTSQIQTILPKQKTIIIEATDEETGLAVLNNLLPNFVLIDGISLGIDSFSCCRNLRSIAGSRNLPIFMLADIKNERFIEQAFESGATDCINKPINRALLLGKLNYLLQASRVVEELQKQQSLREELIWEITERIRQILELQEIFNATVTEVRKFLDCDRVLFYHVLPSGAGQVVASSVVSGLPSLLGENIDDPCFRETYLNLYRKGRVCAIDNIETAELDPCYVNLIKPFNVKASLVVPILKEESFWGLLIVHHCTAPRHWPNSEIHLLKQLASQVSIALNQAQHLETIESALEKEKNLNELKARFFSMTSHDVRIPLALILTSAELLQNFGHKFSQEKKDSHFQKIQVSVKRINNLLEDARAVIKELEPNFTFNPQLINLPKFCQNIVDDIKLTLSEEDSMEFKMVGEFVNYCLDKKLLEHILINLLENAIKYSPGGGHITFELIGEQNSAIFRIKDSGIGIPKQDIPKVFNYSYRASNIGNISETGLGLAIVKNCVDLHRGKITVESEVGVGTTFTVILPLNIDTSNPKQLVLSS